MRWATFEAGADGVQRVGLLHDGRLLALEPGLALVDLLGDDGERLQRAGERARKAPAGAFALDESRLCAPIPRPPSVRDFMAFEAHYLNVQRALGREMPAVWYEQPVFYFSNPAAIVGPHATVPMAPATRAWDYELEVAAIVGRGGRDLHPDAAERHIAGYSVLCDFSARDLQASESPVGLGPTKAKDTATSLGPFLVTPDELTDARAAHGFALTMRARVNGKLYSEGRLDTLDWSFGELLAFASRGTELRPGDLIGTGTVGTGCILELMLMHGAERYPWLAPGDVVELEVERLGRLRHRVAPGAEPVALAPRRRRPAPAAGVTSPGPE